jgi:multicomponent Na+:H+ antiporter subunit G
VHLIVAGAFIGLGVLLLVLSGIGLHKYPDFFYKIHIASKGPSLGIMLILIGVAVHFGAAITIIKCLAIAFFIFITVPVSSSLVALTRYEAMYGTLEEDDEITERGRLKRD